MKWPRLKTGTTVSIELTEAERRSVAYTLDLMTQHPKGSPIRDTCWEKPEKTARRKIWDEPPGRVTADYER